MYNSSNKSCQDALSTQNTSQHTSARAKAPTREQNNHLNSIGKLATNHQTSSFRQSNVSIKITNRLQFKKWKNYFNIRLRTGTGDVKWKKEFNAYNTSSKSCQDALSTHNTPQRTLKQSGRLPILRRKMRCLPTLQDTTNPYGLRGDTPLKLSHPTPTDRDRRCQLAKRVSAIIHRDALRTPLTRNSRFPLHCPEETH